MAQMRPGARQILDHTYADLEEVFNQTCDPKVQKLLMVIERRISKELEPLLERATPQEPSAEMRERAMAQEIRELKQWRASWVAAVRAAFPEPRPREIDDYLETFDADSAANRAAREQVWQALDAETQAELIRLNREKNPQLFS